MSLSSTLNRFCTLLWCLHCWKIKAGWIRPSIFSLRVLQHHVVHWSHRKDQMLSNVTFLFFTINLESKAKRNFAKTTSFRRFSSKHQIFKEQHWTLDLLEKKIRKTDCIFFRISYFSKKSCIFRVILTWCYILRIFLTPQKIVLLSTSHSKE